MNVETVSTTEAARMLGKTRQTIRIWCEDGKVESTTDENGCYRIPQEVVEKLARRTRVKPAHVQRRLITIQEAAQILGITATAMKDLITQRRIPHIPSPVRVDILDVERFIEQSKVPALNAASTSGSI